jgi:UDP-N-acetylmuramoyl-L-alanyl-D-glutamate--2,6-diaminopimelate ligase
MTSAGIRTREIVDALLAAGELVAVQGVIPPTFHDLIDDSRLVQPGSLFVAVRGTTQDGHAFVPQAIRAGAAAVIVEESDGMHPALVVRSGRRAAALAARAAFRDPSSALLVAGVTGTNGKTTTVDILRQLLDAPASPAASIGTLGVRVGRDGETVPGSGALTTPGVIELQRTLRLLSDRGVRHVAMEVSSHSLDQDRVAGIRFGAAVFTNVSRDHLDYHGTMDAYVAAKARLVGHLASDGVLVVNADDPAWAVLAPGPSRLTFAIDSPADVMARDIRFASDGSDWILAAGGRTVPVALPLLGAFNVANALGAAACAWALGVPLDEIGARLGLLRQVPGRLERLLDRPVVLRDYAHTPDALERALGALRPLVPGRLIVVFGCGGDRDRGKRPLMGAVAGSRADHVILTSDNPRTEDPERILDDIEEGMRGRAHERIEDRRAAIARALRVAGEGDLVLLAGKGHETYQIRGTTSYHFDEREVVAELAGALPAGSA